MEWSNQIEQQTKMSKSISNFTCLDLPPSNFCRFIAWFSWAKLEVPEVFFTFVPLKVIEHPTQSTLNRHEDLREKKIRKKEKYTHLLKQEDGLALLECDVFGFRADGFLIKLAIFLAVWCFLEFVPGIDEIGVQASFATWTTGLQFSLLLFASFVKSEGETNVADALRSAEQTETRNKIRTSAFHCLLH